MSLIAPNNRPRGGGQGKGGPRRQQNNKLYSHPLPLLLVPPPRTRTSLVTSRVLGLCGFSSITVENPHCEGVFDRATKSVWVTNKKDAMILWRRGFFGKGDLSRSEPSWYTRQVNARNEAAASGGKCASDGVFSCVSTIDLMLALTSEEIREKRRAERKQFKLDRARALAQAAEEAENAFKEGRQANVVAIPSGATWKPQQPSATEHVQAVPEAFPEEEDEELKEEEPLEDVEHLQLTLQEAFFLIWNFDCLTIFDPLFVRFIFLFYEMIVDFVFIVHTFACFRTKPLPLNKSGTPAKRHIGPHCLLPPSKLYTHTPAASIILFLSTTSPITTTAL